jgi:hypothetical protein
MRKKLFVVSVLLGTLITPAPVYASETISSEDFYCEVSEELVDTIDVVLPNNVAADLMGQGITAVRAKLYSNDGLTRTSTPSILTENSNFIFRFSNLGPQKYNCYLAALTGEVQGPWSESNSIRLGEIPKCKLGYAYLPKMSLDGKSEVSATETCRPYPWSYEYFDDGFDKYFSISMETYDRGSDSYGAGPDVQIFCDKRKLEVYVWAEYADGLGWSGSGQVKFDSASSKKISYQLQKDFDGIVLKDPKTFMSSLAKAKSTFGFKIPTVDGYATPTYLKGNLLEYRSMFAKAGCKF